MIGVKHISQLSASGNWKSPRVKLVKLIDQIPEDVQLRILAMHKDGMSRRVISNVLIAEGVPSPKMTLPWGINAITVVIAKYKEKV
jgi:hypothetical protein